jgi:hypothetical protein
MKKLLLCMALLAVLSMPASVGLAQITSTENGHIGHHGCSPCHVTHETDYTEGVPLWSGAQSGETFIMYDDGDAPTQIVSVIADQPTGGTKLCLSCHDGIGSAYIGRHDAGTHSNMGTDLRHTHPVSFPYAPAATALPGEYVHPDDVPQGYLDRIGDVQCSSCHDVHLDGSRSLTYLSGGETIIWHDEVDPDTGDPIPKDPLLRGNGLFIDGFEGGLMCQTCHLKGVVGYTPPVI